MNDYEILKRVSELSDRRSEIIERSMKDASLVSARDTVALNEIRAELDELRVIQIANRGHSFSEVIEKEQELRKKRLTPTKKISRK